MPANLLHVRIDHINYMYVWLHKSFKFFTWIHVSMPGYFALHLLVWQQCIALKCQLPTQQLIVNFIKLYAFQFFIIINSRIAMRNLLWITNKQHYCMSLDHLEINYTHSCTSLLNLFTMIKALKTKFNIEWGIFVFFFAPWIREELYL